MKQKQKNYLFGSLVFIFIAAFGVTSLLFLTGHDRADATANKTQVQPSIVTSQFSFAKTEGWTKGPSNDTSIAAFHEGSDGCFVSAEYKSDSLDKAVALQKTLDSFTAIGYNVIPHGEVNTSISIGDKQQAYQLHQYTVKATDSTPAVNEGNEFGFIALETGYIKVEGHCSTSQGLSVTVPALHAITFNGTK